MKGHINSIGNDFSEQNKLKRVAHSKSGMYHGKNEKEKVCMYLLRRFESCFQGLQESFKEQPLLTGTGESFEPLGYPIVVVNVEGVKYRALLDTGAGSSYATAAILSRGPMRDHCKEMRGIDMTIGSVTRDMDLSAAESTKLRIVYDASARAYPVAPILNDCLNAADPPHQNHLWSVLARMRFHPGDLKLAFLQVRIKQAERDALRFHWKTKQTKDFFDVTYRL